MMPFYVERKADKKTFQVLLIGIEGHKYLLADLDNGDMFHVTTDKLISDYTFRNVEEIELI